MSITRIRFAALAALVVACQFNFAAAASFDCAKAQTPIERSICSSPPLSELDSSLALAYKGALERSPSPDQLRAEQRTWLRDIRNKCTSPVCLTDTYQQRITALSPAAAPSFATPSTSAPVEEVPMADASESESNTVLCDRLAAHPDDPEAVAQGVLDEQLIVGRATTACENAIKENPELPRLHFQLARNYLAGDRIEDGVEQLILAAEAGHGAALAFLGDVHLSGVPGIEPDPLLAQEFYEKALASGFEPARKILAEFVDMTEEFKSADGEQNAFSRFFSGIAAWFKNLFHGISERIARLFDSKGEGVEIADVQRNAVNASRQSPEELETEQPMPPASENPPAPPSVELTAYINPDIMNGIDNRKFDQITHNEAWVKEYLANIADNIRVVCESGFTIAEINNLKAEIKVDAFNIGADMPIASLLGVLGFMTTSAKDPFAILRLTQQQTLDPGDKAFSESMKDTEALFQRHMCNTPGLARFSKNLTAFVHNEEAPIPPQRGIMNACTQNPPPSPYPPNEFCLCFSGMLSSSHVTQAERKALLKDFQKTAINIMDFKGNSLLFQACRTEI